MSSMPKNTYEDGLRDGFDVGTTNTIDIVKEQILSLKPRTFEEIFGTIGTVANSNPFKPYGQSANGKTSELFLGGKNVSKIGGRKSRKYKSKKN
jgi:hypothetical protein